MTSEHSLEDSSLPVKVAEPDVSAPPTLAEPASGPAAEMSGALGGASSEDKPDAEASKSEVNGATESASATAPSDAPGSSSAAPEPPTTSAEEVSSAANTKAGEDVEGKTEEPVAEPTGDEASTNTNGAADSKQSSKRKSSGIPEHKGKKLNKKKSIAKITHLDAKPGDHFFARLRSYPPWPSIICDENMLPSSLLNTRPVTAMKADGTYNEAYAEGGKKVNERTYPIMFLHTNEFAWIPNTDLGDLNPDQCKDVPEKGKSKSLLQAYAVAAEQHDLEHFRSMLTEHANAMAADEAQKQEAEEAKQNKAKEAKEKKKRKSEVKAKRADDDEDVEMEDAEDAAETKKSSKKRKKAAESDDEEPEKPAKTPKTQKLKLTTSKTPNTDKKTKEKTEKPAKAKSEKRKSKAAPVDDDEEMADAPEEEPPKPIDPVEQKKAREKEVLFLRHRLQKGFLFRDQAPVEEDMPQMAQYIKRLEEHGELEVGIIRTTKINKVLKALVKLNTIPRDEEFSFRKRSVDLLGKWNKVLGAEPQDDAATEEKETAKSTPATNGVHEGSADEKSEVKKEQTATATPAAPTEEPKEDTATDAQAGAASETQPADAPSTATGESKNEAPAATTEAPPAAADSTPAETHETTKATEPVASAE